MRYLTTNSLVESAVEPVIYRCVHEDLGDLVKPIQIKSVIQIDVLLEYLMRL